MSETQPKNERLAKRIGAYVELRDRLAAEKKRQAAELKPLLEALEKVEGMLTEDLNTAGSDSLTVRDVGTVYRTVEESATVSDKDAFRTFVLEAEQHDLCDFRANKTGVRAFIEANGGTLPPGVNFRQSATIGVRRA